MSCSRGDAGLGHSAGADNSDSNPFSTDSFVISVHGNMQHIPYDSAKHKASFTNKSVAHELKDQSGLSLFPNTTVQKIDTARNYAYKYFSDDNSSTRRCQKSQVWIASKWTEGDKAGQTRFDAFMTDISTTEVGTVEIPLDLPTELVRRCETRSSEMKRTCPLFLVELNPTRQLRPEDQYDEECSIETYADIFPKGTVDPDKKTFLMVQSSVDCHSGRRGPDSGMHNQTAGEHLRYTVEGYRLISGLEGGQGREAESLQLSKCTQAIKEALDMSTTKSTDVFRIKKLVRDKYPKDWYQYEQHLDGKDGKVKQVQGLTLTTLGMRTDEHKPKSGVLTVYYADDDDFDKAAMPKAPVREPESDFEQEVSRMGLGFLRAGDWERVPAGEEKGSESA